MNISSSAVRRGVTFTMIFLIVIGFGLFSLTQLQTDLLPDIDFPIVIIMTSYTGVAPEDIENLITRPIEEVMIGVEDVQTVSSQSMFGTSVVIVEFSWGSDIDKAEIDIIKRLDLIREALPDDATEPMTIAMDPSFFPVLVLGITSSTASLIDLREISERQIEPRVERIPGVGLAYTGGGLDRQVQVHFDPYALSAKGLSVSEIIQALRMDNVRQPGGYLTQTDTEFTVRTLSTYTSVDQIENTVVGHREGEPIYLRNVATVRDWYEEARGLSRIDQSPSVVLVIQKQADANTVQTVRQVQRELPNIAQAIGEDIQFVEIFNQAEFINQSIFTLRNTALIAFFLVGIVLLFFTHNFRSSAIVMVSIPIAIIATFFVMYIADLTLNIISLAGLALAVGLIVDNSIVVLENIYRLREEGGDRINSAIDGSTQVSKAITASALTTLAVFIPVLFVPAIAGELFGDMVVTISFSIAIALLVALTLIPLLSSRFLKMNGTQGLNSSSGGPSKIAQRVTIWFEWLRSKYEKSLRWALGHKKLTIGAAVILFIISMGILGIIGTDFFPDTDTGSISFNIETPEGTALHVTDEIVRQIEQYIVDNIPEKEIVNSTVGVAGGPLAQMQGRGSHSAGIRLELVSRRNRDRTQFEVEDQIRRYVETIPGIQEFYFQDEGMAGMGEDVEVKIFGYELDDLRSVSEDAMEKIREIPGVVDIRSPLEGGLPELHVDIDRERLSRYGLRTIAVSDVVYSSIQGAVATFYNEEGEDYDVVVRLPREFRQRIEILENLLITIAPNTHIPIKAIAEIRRDIAPFSIQREDQQRLASIALSVSGRDLGSVISDIHDKMQNVEMPADMRYEIGGVAEDMQESFFYLTIAFLVATVLVYMVMAANFESFLHPFLIIVSIPLAMIGVLWMLLITGTTVSVTALMGMVILVGIVVNNGIVLVDFINQLRDKGLNLLDAVTEAGKVRLRPVLMTAFTTIFAMLPLAIGMGEGSEIWAPLARAVIGGMIFSTVVILLLVPVLYMGTARFSKKYKYEAG